MFMTGIVLISISIKGEMMMNNLKKNLEYLENHHPEIHKKVLLKSVFDKDLKEALENLNRVDLKNAITTFTRIPKSLYGIERWFVLGWKQKEHFEKLKKQCLTEEQALKYLIKGEK